MPSVKIVVIDPKDKLHDFLLKAVDNPLSDFSKKLKDNGRQKGFGSKIKYMEFKGVYLEVFTAIPKNGIDYREAMTTVHFIKTGPSKFESAIMKRCDRLGIKFKWTEGYMELPNGKIEMITDEKQIFMHLNMPYKQAYDRKGFNPNYNYKL